MKNKVFYFHIPKTAGSSLNNFFHSYFDSNRILTHIEIHPVLKDLTYKEIENKYDFLSGHISFPVIQNKFNLNKWATVATFRMPLEQVISHLTFVRELGEPSEIARLQNHAPQIQKIVHQLVRTDLSNPDEIKKLIEWLENEKIFLFHDTQTRYLAGCTGKIMPKDLKKAQENINKIDYIGITERLDEFVMMLSYYYEWKIPQQNIEILNKTRKRYGLDIHNEQIAKALVPLIKYDRMIYKIARKKFIEDLHDFLSELEMKYPRFSSLALQKVKMKILLSTRNN